MARERITVTQITRAGTAEPTEKQGDTDGMYFEENDGNIWLVIRNATGASITVTVLAAATVAGQALAPTSIVVPANSTRVAGPWPPKVFNQENDDVYIFAAGAGNTGVHFRAYGI